MGLYIRPQAAVADVLAVVVVVAVDTVVAQVAAGTVAVVKTVVEHCVLLAGDAAQ